MARNLKSLLGMGSDEPDQDEKSEEKDESMEATILQEVQQAEREVDKTLLEDGDDRTEKRLQKEAEREVQSAAEESLRRLHVIQMGRCPKCGEHLRRHLFASICESCGWFTYEVPRSGPVRVHLNAGGTVEGERCYVVRTGHVLLVNKNVVSARIPTSQVSWIEYLWTDEEIDQRHKQVVDSMTLRCGWCNGEADPESDGFHLVHVAFGTSQERYVFCSDRCYEAFRKMYPARVHRNCYERNCAECNLCVKRYDDETEGIHMLAKDRLTLAPRKRLKKKV